MVAMRRVIQVSLLVLLIGVLSVLPGLAQSTGEMKPKSGATFENTWIVDGDVPVLVAAMVVLGKIK